MDLAPPAATAAACLPRFDPFRLGIRRQSRASCLPEPSWKPGSPRRCLGSQWHKVSHHRGRKRKAGPSLPPAPQCFAPWSSLGVSRENVRKLFQLGKVFFTSELCKIYVGIVKEKQMTSAGNCFLYINKQEKVIPSDSAGRSLV